jgi:hypothetical protein
VARREEKRVHTNGNKEYNEFELRKLEYLRNTNESRAFYQKLSKMKRFST